MSLQMENPTETVAGVTRTVIRTSRRNSAASPTRKSARGGDLRQVLSQFYEAMSARLGPMSWWPARTPFEVIVGAILTQNTAWVNVERAIDNLRQARLLTPSALERVPRARLARLIRSSGYFRQKAIKLKAFVRFLREGYGGSLARMFRRPTAELREELLAVHGVGPETADSILLYSGHHPAFVVDAYTRRILERHGLAGEKASYDDLRQLFESNLPREAKLWNDYHALIVNVGKNWCRTRNPLCEQCPLGQFLPAESKAALLKKVSATAEART